VEKVKGSEYLLNAPYLFRQSLAAGLYSPGPWALPSCGLSLSPWPNTPKTNKECFIKILTLSGVCLVGALQSGGPLGTGLDDQAICVQVKRALQYY
jgi:hypothetical protein